MLLLRGEKRKAFTGLCIIKQLRKLIRVGGKDVQITQLIISMATTAPVDDLRQQLRQAAAQRA